ncbi:MAG: hypothetical protein LBS74_07415 [Oscillospiraceae bacterium]|nr:hypothetical protein [Oscillospiraceae bacterium]
MLKSLQRVLSLVLVVAFIAVGLSLAQSVQLNAHAADEAFQTNPMVSGGQYHTIALMEDGTVWAWGQNDFGQLGDGTTTNRLSPVQVSGLSNVTTVSAGYNHNLALKSDGTVWAWGQNSYGQIGDGTTTSRRTPVQISGLTV